MSRPQRNCRNQVNYRESSESDSDEFEDVNSTFDNTLTDQESLRAPRVQSFQSPRAPVDQDHPQFPLQPQPPSVQEVLTGAAERLVQVENLQADIADIEENLQAIMVNFDEENGTDGTDALAKAINALKGYQWDMTDIEFTFNQVEIKMQTNGVKKQWSKLQALTTILPKVIIEDLKPLLRKKETEFAGNNSYLLAKTKIMKIFKPAEDAGFERAMSRVLSSTPSQLARAIVNDLCEHELDGCCCRRIVLGI